MRKHGVIWVVGLTAALLGACLQSTENNNNTGICGNGDLNPGEECDDGNTIDHDGCSSTCEVEGFCGNSVVEPGEECDDGNFTDGDDCNAYCQTETGCGDGRLEVGEQCDDDNLTDGDGCNALCEDEVPGSLCGNAILEVGELCDDGNTAAGDGCSVDCKREDGCGNGVVEAPELCDDGNTTNGDGCSDVCRVEFVCGNNYCETENYETCYLCPSDCCPDCGDGELDAGEECDDGNSTDGDGCDKGCGDEDGTSVCGNGLWEAGEECEDGNTIIHDGCSDTCEMEFVCGDQICEDTMGETCERCQIDCCPNCGNGVHEPLENEICDSLDFSGVTCQDFCYSGGSITCTDWCTTDLSTCTGTLPVCGNGIVECGEECDGANLDSQTCNTLNHDGGSLSCAAGCLFDVSACGPLMCLPLDQAIRLQEASHMDPDYVAIINLSVCPTDVQGLHLQTNDGSLSTSFALPSQILQPGEVVYLVESTLGSGTDINLGYNISWVANDDGFALLCNGSCTVTANVVDAVLFGATPPALPSPLVFTPAALGDLATNQAYVRTAFTDAAPSFYQADWTIAANTH